MFRKRILLAQEYAVSVEEKKPESKTKKMIATNSRGTVSIHPPIEIQTGSPVVYPFIILYSVKFVKGERIYIPLSGKIFRFLLFLRQSFISEIGR